MSLTKIIAAAASCIFVFLMMPATAGVKAGDGRMTANDTPGRVVVDSKTSVVASLTLGVVGSAVVVNLKKYFESEYPENTAVAKSDLEVFTLTQSFPMTQSFPVTKRSFATQKPLR
jgi:hypothetical protein